MKLAVSPWGNTDGHIGPFSKIFTEKYNPVLATTKGLKGADALLLWGGKDIHPSFYGEKSHYKNQTRDVSPVDTRDLIEWHLMREAYDLGIPIIGVCRGAQFICAFAGGKLIQDVTNHNCSHEIRTYNGLSIYAPADHHQMMHVDGVNYELLAWADARSTHYSGPEGEIVREIKVDPEVVLFPDVNGFAIQPHPEWGPMGTEFNNWLLEEINFRLFK